MKLSNKQQLGVGLGSVALITFFTTMSYKLARSIKNNIIKKNCENYKTDDDRKEA